MKKAKILALVLVAAFMLTGGAYALWNQTINLSTTDTMGNMNATITCGSSVNTLSSMPAINNGGSDLEDYMYPVTSSVISDAHGIQVTVGNMYPGAKYGVNYTIKNTGTVPFALSDAAVTCSAGPDLFAKLTGSFQFTYTSLATNRSTPITVAPTALSSTAALKTAIMNAFSGVVIYPGDQLTGYYNSEDKVATAMQVLVDGGISGSDLEGASTTFNIAFVWQQCQPTYHT